MLTIPIVRVDEARRTVVGRAVQEVIDNSGEIFDYESSKPYFQEWSANVSAVTRGASLGNVREMHGTTAAGKITSIDFDDHERAIDVAIKVVDDGSWQKVLQGVFTGLSIGGRYIRRWADVVDGQMVQRYTASPTELSLVDSPCVPTARFFDIHKRDGSVRRVAFQHQSEVSMHTPRDENFCGRSTAANMIKAALGAPAGDLAQCFGKAHSGRADRLQQGVSARLEKQLAAAGMRVKGPATAGRNGVEGGTLDAIKAIHTQGPRKASPISVPPQSSNAAPAPKATRADLQGGYPEFRTPPYEAPPLLGPPQSANESAPALPPGDNDQYGFTNALKAIAEIHRRGPVRGYLR